MDINYTGVVAANIRVETHVANTTAGQWGSLLVPHEAPFYADGFVLQPVINGEVGDALVEGMDYRFALKFASASFFLEKPIYGGILLLGEHTDKSFVTTYYGLGGKWVGNPNAVYATLADNAYNPRTVYWDQVTNVQETFPPIVHESDFKDTKDADDLVAAITSISTAVANRPQVLDPEVTNRLIDLGTVMAKLNDLESRVLRLEQIV